MATYRNRKATRFLQALMATRHSDEYSGNESATYVMAMLGANTVPKDTVAQIIG